MKAYVIEGTNSAAVREIPKPKLKNDEVLIRIKSAGLCGTDAHIQLGEYFAQFPIVPGHEFSGEVVEVGAAVTRFQPGERVSADPNIFCEKCPPCQANNQNFCDNFQAVGVTRDGAFAEFTAVPESSVFSIDDIPYTEAALIEPLACVVYGQERARPPLGGSVLIFGAGPIGLLHLQLARINGAATVTVVDIRTDRLALAEKLGADRVLVSSAELAAQLQKVSPRRFDLVIDSTGVPQVVQNALQYVSSGGTLLVFGVCPQGSRVEFDPYEIFRRDLKIVGSFALKKTFPQAIALLKSGRIKVAPLIGTIIGLDELPQTMKYFIDGKTDMKVVVVPAAD